MAELFQRQFRVEGRERFVALAVGEGSSSLQTEHLLDADGQGLLARLHHPGMTDGLVALGVDFFREDGQRLVHQRDDG